MFVGEIVYLINKPIQHQPLGKGKSYQSIQIIGYLSKSFKPNQTEGKCR